MKDTSPFAHADVELTALKNLLTQGPQEQGVEPTETLGKGQVGANGSDPVPGACGEQHIYKGEKAGVLGRSGGNSAFSA